MRPTSGWQYMCARRPENTLDRKSHWKRASKVGNQAKWIPTIILEFESPAQRGAWGSREEDEPHHVPGAARSGEKLSSLVGRNSGNEPLLQSGQLGKECPA